MHGSLRGSRMRTAGPGNEEECTSGSYGPVRPRGSSSPAAPGSSGLAVRAAARLRPRGRVRRQLRHRLPRQRRALLGRPGFTRRCEQDVSEGLDVDGPVDWVLHLASPGVAGRLPAAADRDPEGRQPRHDARARPGRAEGRPVPARLHLGGVRRPAGASAAGDVLGQRQPDRPAQRVRRGEAVRRGADHGLPQRARAWTPRIVRIFNTYGPRMRLDDGRAIPTFMSQALAGEPLTVAGDGSQTRSLCYVEDTVEGILALAASEHAGTGQHRQPGRDDDARARRARPRADRLRSPVRVRRPAGRRPRGPPPGHHAGRASCSGWQPRVSGRGGARRPWSGSRPARPTPLRPRAAAVGGREHLVDSDPQQRRVRRGRAQRVAAPGAVPQHPVRPGRPAAPSGAGGVGPKSITEGVPYAVARCATPVSPQTTSRAAATTAASSSRSVAPGEHRLRGSPAARRRRSARSDLVRTPVTTTSWPARGSAARDRGEPVGRPAPRRRRRARVHDHGARAAAGAPGGAAAAGRSGRPGRPGRPRRSRHQRRTSCSSGPTPGRRCPAAGQSKATSRRGRSAQQQPVALRARGRAG